MKAEKPNGTLLDAYISNYLQNGSQSLLTFAEPLPKAETKPSLEYKLPNFKDYLASQNINPNLMPEPNRRPFVLQEHVNIKDYMPPPLHASSVLSRPSIQSEAPWRQGPRL